MSEATPRPWKVGKTGNQEAWIDGIDKRLHDSWKGMVIVNGCDDAGEMGQEIAEANRAYILRAVNRHDELVAALRDLREAATVVYKAGRISAEPFVRAGNVLAKATPDDL